MPLVSTPLVSVVVPTRNSARTLDACLASVRGQDHPAVELIVVDNHSADGTSEIAGRWADRVIVAGPERSAQRNLGIRAAAGEYVLWIDSDMVLRPAVVSAALATAATAATAAVAIPETSWGEGFFSACRALERSCYVDEPRIAYPRLVRRAVLLELGGFDESLTGTEDMDLRFRLDEAGHQVAVSAEFIDHDEGRLTLRGVASKRAYYGRGLVSFGERHPGAVRAQGTAVLRAYARHLPRLLRHPVLASGMVALRGAEAAGYALAIAHARRERRR
jgi:glycosyltransferase involved in cell wall biosynthesis